MTWGIWRILTEHSKTSKLCILIDSFCAKYVPFDLEKCRVVVVHDTKEWCKILKKTGLWFGKWHEESRKFSPEHSKVSKLGLWWDLFFQSRKRMSLKFIEELCVVTMKNDSKFKKELTMPFQNWHEQFWLEHPKNLKSLYFNAYFN